MKMPMERPEIGKFYFAGMNLGSEGLLTHAAILGASGSGKTLTQRLMYQASFAPFLGFRSSRPGQGVKSLYSDIKGDGVRIFLGIGEALANGPYANIPDYLMNLRDSMIISNPWDSRSSGWAMSKDVTDFATALEIAENFVPKRGVSQPFFDDATRDILSGVLQGYVDRKLEFTLRDVLIPLLDEDSSMLRAVLASSEVSRDRLQYFENESNVWQSIRSTIRTVLAPFRIIASLWHRAASHEKTIDGRPRVFSLNDWVASDCNDMLMLGHSFSLTSTLQTINKALFKRCSQLLLDQSELAPDDTRRFFVCLDELPVMGKLEGLSELLTNSRSRGGSVFIGAQDWDSILDQELYGPEGGNVMLSNCASKAFFRMGSGSSAKFCAENFGEKERYEKTESEGESYNWDSGFTTDKHTSERKEKSDVVLSSEFLNMPMPSQGLVGIYSSPHLRERFPNTSFIKRTLSFDDIKKYLFDLAGPEHDFNHNKRPSEHQRFIPWSEEECAKFGVPYLPGLLGEPKEISHED